MLLHVCICLYFSVLHACCKHLYSFRYFSLDIKCNFLWAGTDASTQIFLCVPTVDVDCLIIIYLLQNCRWLINYGRLPNKCKLCVFYVQLYTNEITFNKSFAPLNSSVSLHPQDLHILLDLCKTKLSSFMLAYAHVCSLCVVHYRSLAF